MITIEFLNAAEDTTRTFGPYAWVQVTNVYMRTPEDDQLASLNEDGYWVTEDGTEWSDFSVESV